MLGLSAHEDTFARDSLPAPELWPDFKLEGFDYPERLNAGYELTDAMVGKGFGDHTALIGNGRQRTYKELADWTNRLAHVLVEELGVRPGNRVLIRSANNPAMVACWLAATKAGAVVINTMPMLRAGELTKIVNKAEVLPFQLDKDLSNEDIRMKYRYLDIRRNPVKERLIFRSKVAIETRKHLAGEGFIEIETQKTGQTVVIPMHPQVKEILEKRNGFPESISDQKFNLYIKEVCEEAKLNGMTEGSKINPKTNRKEKGIYPKHELVTSHICRRSFASNLYGKLPNLVIMGITGHQTEAQFLKYIKITPKENAKKLQEFWQKQQEENQFEKMNMKVVK